MALFARRATQPYLNDTNIVGNRRESWRKLEQYKKAKRQEEFAKRTTRASRPDDEEHVFLNVGGRTFETRKLTLRNVPSTKLALLSERSEHYDAERGSYFFDRNPYMFVYILDFYRTATMHLPNNICANSVRDELKFWGLGDGCIAECCRKHYFDELDSNRAYELIKTEFFSLPKYVATTSSQTSSQDAMSTWKDFRNRAWVSIDNPESSQPAKVYGAIYFTLVLLTICVMFVSTVSDARQPLQKHILLRNAGEIMPTLNYADTLNNSTIMHRLLTTDASDVLVVIDLLCLFFFTVDSVVRFIVCPSIKTRLKSLYTALDLMYIIPSWIKLFVDVSQPLFWQRGAHQAYLLMFIEFLLVSRGLRILRVSRHYRGLRVLLLAIKASVSEFLLLGVFVGLTMTIFASFIYCAEQYEDHGQFESAFKGAWWALITMTTVGYGDTYPTGNAGKIVACFCALTGLLVIAMVIPIIAGNFHLYYGFRHAGREDVHLYKPEFIPTVKDNYALPQFEFDSYPDLDQPQPGSTNSLFDTTNAVTDQYDRHSGSRRSIINVSPEELAGVMEEKQRKKSLTFASKEDAESRHSRRNTGLSLVTEEEEECRISPMTLVDRHTSSTSSTSSTSNTTRFYESNGNTLPEVE